jgi:hypothetical protein
VYALTSGADVFDLTPAHLVEKGKEMIIKFECKSGIFFHRVRCLSTQFYKKFLFGIIKKWVIIK